MVQICMGTYMGLSPMWGWWLYFSLPSSRAEDS